MKLFAVTLLLIIYSYHSFGQKDALRKTSFIVILNSGLLCPNKTWTEEFKDGSASYSRFTVTPKNGINSIVSAGISTKLKNIICIENLIGYGYSENIYLRNGLSFNYYTDSFRGAIKTKIIEHRVLLSTGITISNSKIAVNKFYFSNYFSTNLTFMQISKNESYNVINKKEFSSIDISSIHYRRFSFNSTHIISYGLQLKNKFGIPYQNKILKVGIGINLYFINRNKTYINTHKGYINPLLNLTLNL